MRSSSRLYPTTRIDESQVQTSALFVFFGGAASPPMVTGLSRWGGLAGAASPYNDQASEADEARSYFGAEACRIARASFQKLEVERKPSEDDGSF